MARITRSRRLSNNLGIWDPGEMDEKEDERARVERYSRAQAGYAVFHWAGSQTLRRMYALNVVLAWYLAADFYGIPDLPTDLKTFLETLPPSEAVKKGLSLYDSHKASLKDVHDFEKFIDKKFPVRIYYEVGRTLNFLSLRDWAGEVWKVINESGLGGMSGEEMKIFDEINLYT